jgi:hypothetical protein
MTSNPQVNERRRHYIKCRQCESTDINRVYKPDGLWSKMFHNGQKPFQCRACRYSFYHQARRRSDSPVAGGEKDSRFSNIRWTRLTVGIVSGSVILAALLLGQKPHSQSSGDRTGMNNATGMLSAQARSPSAPFLPVHTTPDKFGLAERDISYAPPVLETMTNGDVNTLRKAGLSDDLIIAKIHSVHCSFKLETTDIVVLKTAGVSNNLISAMLQAMRTR